MKHNGIGKLLLQAAENHARINIKNVSCIQLGAHKEQWFESYHFYQKNGYTEYKESYMKKQIVLMKFLFVNLVEFIGEII